MDNNEPYVPVSCSIHSEYELLIMHQDKIQLRWLDDKGITALDMVTAKDLQTKAGEEFLVVEDRHGKQYHVRLDKIQFCKKL